MKSLTKKHIKSSKISINIKYQLVKENSSMDTKEIAGKIFMKALTSVDPSFIVKGYADKIRSYYSMKGFTKLIVAGFGKAAFQMAQAVEEMFDNDQISGGIVVTKYGHAERQGKRGIGEKGSGELKKIKVLEAAHPVPDENGFKAAEEIIRLVKDANENTLVLCLISGAALPFLFLPVRGFLLPKNRPLPTCF
jgi:hydroxypyruvate reductase